MQIFRDIFLAESFIIMYSFMCCDELAEHDWPVIRAVNPLKATMKHNLQMEDIHLQSCLKNVEIFLD